MKAILMCAVILLTQGLIGAGAAGVSVADPSGPSVYGGSGESQFWVAAESSTHARYRQNSSPNGTAQAKSVGRPVDSAFHNRTANTGSSCGADIDGFTCGSAIRTSCVAATLGQAALAWLARPGDPCSPDTATATRATAAAAAGPAPLPQVTPGVALSALRRIGLPALQARTQPEDKTLVNFATIFYTEPEPFTRTVTLLGRQVRMQATPSSFTWHYGDGTSTTTSTPGAPYPAKDVTHEYRDAHATVRTSVDVTYTATFQVAGGPEQAIPGSVTISGPTAPLRISEATAVLSGDRT